jgi:hypothetical protein
MVTLYSELTEEQKIKKRGYVKKYKEKNKDKISDYQKTYLEKWREENRNHIKEYYENNKDRSTLDSIRTRAKRSGLPFDIDLEDINNYDICPVFGFKLERGSLSEKRKSPSVDRIVPSRGYVKGNIQIISDKANSMKQGATPEELRMFAKWVLKTFPEEETDG